MAIADRLNEAVLPGAAVITRRFPAIGRLINDWPFARSFLSGVVVDVTSSRCPPRPHRLSLWTPPGSAGDTPPPWATRTPPGPDDAPREVRRHAYVSWPSLTDEAFTGRHLPPVEAKNLPPLSEIRALYARPPEGMRKSKHNSALLAFFAQWFTDSFLRTHPVDLRRNTSNHEIDSCQVYGLNETRTRALSAPGGRLASRETPTGEYPRLLLQDGEVHPDFAGFEEVARDPQTGEPAYEFVMRRSGLTPEQIAERRGRLYATGLERGNSNIGYTAMSTLFLREHNRLADAIRKAHGDWPDDRVFETARNTVIVIGLKLVIEDYIVQLAQSLFRLVLDPGLAPRRPWYRTNRIAIEFNLLYRWHSMVPDEVDVAGRPLPFQDLQSNNALLEAIGLGPVVDALSRQPAGYIGLGNVPKFLLDAEEAAHSLSRGFALAPMNEYRKHFGLDPMRDFEELTPEADLRQRLRDLYGTIDRVEFLPGMFAEDERNDASFGSLLLRMVGYDAFTQALTNPLLAPQIYNRDTFSSAGWEAIHETNSLDDVLRRNLPAGSPHRASLGLLPAS